MIQLAERLLDRHYCNADTNTAFSIHLLFYVQLSLIGFAVAVLAVVALFTLPSAKAVYFLICGSSLAVLCGAMALNLSGYHRVSLWTTVTLMFIGPWASILYEYLLRSGDYMPMMYVIIPIQITAMFIKVKPMYWLAVLQTGALAALMLTDPGRSAYNWLSALCFIFVTSMLGTITSYVLRKQYERLIHSRNALSHSEQRLRDIAIRDPLTGLYNRRFMDETFAVHFESLAPMFSLLMVDVDHFKTVNDTYGHSCGDEIIQRVAGILTSAIRKYDVACRYGGDEFLLILNGCGPDDAMAKANKIKQDIENIIVDPQDDTQRPLTASIGVAQCPLNGTSRDAILKAVDAALYQAKENGRNRVVAAEGVFTASAQTPHTR